MPFAATTQKKIEKEPVLVRLGKGEVQQRTCDLLVRLVGLLHVDPKLDIGRVVEGLVREKGCASWYGDCSQRCRV